VAGRKAARPAPPANPLDTPVGDSGVPGATTIRRVGSRLGITTVRDLLLWLPRRYDDLRTVHDLAGLRFAEPDTVVSARARVVAVRAGHTARRGVNVVTAHLADDTGTAEASGTGGNTWSGGFARATTSSSAASSRSAATSSCSTTRPSSARTAISSTSAGSCRSTR